MAQAGICVVVERGVRRGTMMAMAMAEAHTHADLSGIDGFSPGESLADYAALLPGYEEMTEAILALVPVDQVLSGDL